MDTDSPGKLGDVVKSPRRCERCVEGARDLALQRSEGAPSGITMAVSVDRPDPLRVRRPTVGRPAGCADDVGAKRRTSMRKILAICSLVGMFSFVGTLSASANEASPCGAIHGAFANVNGNFGFLGEVGGTPGYHNAVGQEVGATGYNNSTASAACNS
jgi:hypothetical protein